MWNNIYRLNVEVRKVARGFSFVTIGKELLLSNEVTKRICFRYSDFTSSSVLCC